MDENKKLNEATAEFLTFSRAHIAQCLVDLEAAMMPDDPDPLEVFRLAVYAGTSLMIAKDRLAELAGGATDSMSEEEVDAAVKQSDLWIAEVESSYAQNSRTVNRIIEAIRPTKERAN